MRTLTTTLLFASTLVCSIPAQTIVPPYNSSYSLRQIGTPPGVPGPLGGLTFKHDDKDVLLIGGAANRSNGGIYAIRVTRGAAGQVTGFTGTATLLATAPYIDGGLSYGPSNVLFYTRYPNNEIGQIKVGSTSTDKIVSVATGSPGSLTFTPPGFAGAGNLKIAGYKTGQFWNAQIVPDGSGTFDVANLTQTATLSGGPEGIIHVPPGSAQMPNYTRMLVCEYSSGSVSVLTLDQNGEPIPASRSVLLTGLTGAEGATIDPQSGNFMFSTFNGGNQVIVIDGFGSCGTFTNYGQGIPGGNGKAPDIRGTGCASFNRAIQFQTGNGPSTAVGAMNIGFTKLSIPIFSGYLLTEVSIPISHGLDTLGSWSTTLSTPNDPNLVGLHIYFQAAYVDPSAPFGVTATYGLDMLIK